MGGTPELKVYIHDQKSLYGSCSRTDFSKVNFNFSCVFFIFFFTTTDFVFCKSSVLLFCIIGTPCPIEIWSPGHCPIRWSKLCNMAAVAFVSVLKCWELCQICQVIGCTEKRSWVLNSMKLTGHFKVATLLKTCFRKVNSDRTAQNKLSYHRFCVSKCVFIFNLHSNLTRRND